MSNKHQPIRFSLSAENNRTDAGRDGRTRLARLNSQTRAGTGKYSFSLLASTGELESKLPSKVLLRNTSFVTMPHPAVINKKESPHATPVSDDSPRACLKPFSSINTSPEDLVSPENPHSKRFQQLCGWRSGLCSPESPAFAALCDGLFERGDKQHGQVPSMPWTETWQSSSVSSLTEPVVRQAFSICEL